MANLIKFCGDFLPDNVEMAIIMRVSCLLPVAFSKYYLSEFKNGADGTIILREDEANAITSSFNLACALFSIANIKDDRRGKT